MWLLTKVILAACLVQVQSAPTPESSFPRVVKTVTLPNGQVLDWVRIGSQGRVAALPPQPKNPTRATSASPGEVFASIPPELYGPQGTVPIARDVTSTWPVKRPPPTGAADGDDTTFGAKFATESAQSAAGQHWYAAASTQAKSTGAGATFSMYKPYLESRQDFSLLQLALIRQSAENADYGKVIQTLETGWMYYPPKASKPMLFTFYNVNGYAELGDDLGGYNRDYTGWVQVDRDVYPGIEFADYSVVNGKQLDMDVRYHLHDGNWWLRAFGKDIGYYPASLFSKDVNADNTLAKSADRVDVYGEVYNSGEAITTTDMGSGEFADKGDKKSAYIRNIVYIDASGNDKHYSAGATESDHSRYRIAPRWDSGSSWNSYCYVGGPGAGGVVGG